MRCVREKETAPALICYVVCHLYLASCERGMLAIRVFLLEDFLLAIARASCLHRRLYFVRLAFVWLGSAQNRQRKATLNAMDEAFGRLFGSSLVRVCMRARKLLVGVDVYRRWHEMNVSRRYRYIQFTLKRQQLW